MRYKHFLVKTLSWAHRGDGDPGTDVLGVLIFVGNRWKLAFKSGIVVEVEQGSGEGMLACLEQNDESVRFRRLPMKYPKLTMRKDFAGDCEPCCCDLKAW